MNESSYALVRRQAKSIEHAAIISANAAINPIVKEKMVRPSSKPRAPDWSVTKRQMKLFIAQVLPDDKAKPQLIGFSYPELSLP